MIKLTLPPKPQKLTENEARLTAEFQADNNKTVWKQSYIAGPLLAMSHNKCAFSETKLNEESKYMEIEHFRHKKQYPGDVVKWGNLLPSCKTCNTAKGEWDVVNDPIVNPLTDKPGDHLYVKGCRFYAKDQKGKNTIDAVELNNDNHFVVPRFTQAATIAGQLEEKLDNLKNATTPRERHIRLNKIKLVLEQCGPEHPYSAVIATYLLYEFPPFKTMVEYIKNQGLWDDDLENLTAMLSELALPE